MNNARPLTNAKRLPWIDTARGFAIFGIFIVNLATFHGPYFLYGNGNNYWGTGEPGIWQAIVDIFFQASFYSLFSFLFGFGMYIIYENLKERKVESPQSWMVRRLVILLIIGALHAFLIWHGDILITYAVIGFLLLLFLNRKNVTLVTWSLCLLLIPTTLFTGLMYLSSMMVDMGNLANQPAIDSSFQHYGEGSWGDILRQNISDWFFANNPFNFLFIIFNILPIFIFGMLFAKNKWLHDITTHYKTLQKWWIVSFAVFILFKAGPYAFGNPIWFQLMQDAVGGFASAIFYLITTAFLYEKLKGLFQLIGYVGKMALSNYIFQSIIGILLFYSIGLGLYGELTAFQTILIACIVYPIQILLSYLWLKKYKRGPLEWLWRSLIYKQKLSNKRTFTDRNTYEQSENS